MLATSVTPMKHQKHLRIFCASMVEFLPYQSTKFGEDPIYQYRVQVGFIHWKQAVNVIWVLGSSNYWLNRLYTTGLVSEDSFHAANKKPPVSRGFIIILARWLSLALKQFLHSLYFHPGVVIHEFLFPFPWDTARYILMSFCGSFHVSCKRLCASLNILSISWSGHCV